MKIHFRLVPTVATILLISGCSQSSTPQATPSSTPTQTLSSASTHSAVYVVAFAYLQSFLDSWQKDGAYVAGRKYLDTSMWPKQKQGNPVLISGKVSNMQQYSWLSADHFTVMADLDLRFSGNAAAWGNGINTRFVTFVRSSASAQYRITLNTGP